MVNTNCSREEPNSCYKSYIFRLDNGLSPILRQAISLTDDEGSLITTKEIDFKENLMKSNKFSLTDWGRMTHICVKINKPPLVQIMACRLVGAKPLSEPMQDYR